MKLRMFATAAVVAAAAVAAPAFAQDAVGSAGLSVAHTEIDTKLVDLDGQTYTLDGSVAVKATENWTLSLGANLGTADGDLGDDTAFGLNGAFTYNGGDWRVGPTVGFTSIGDESLWTVGGVAQKYFDKVTLTGAINYGQADELDADIWSVNGDVRYFVSDNFRLNAGAGFAKVDTDQGDADLWTAGVGAEYQFASTPWSVFGGYDHVELKDFDVSADTFKIGARYTFGGDLKARDRAGADLPTGIAAFSSVLR